MAKVFGIHQLELKPDVQAAEFEQFVREELSALPMPSGWSVSIARGNRGAQMGEYVLIFEIESVAARDRISPDEATLTAEAEEWYATAMPHMERLNGFLIQAVGESTPYTDWVVVGP